MTKTLQPREQEITGRFTPVIVMPEVFPYLPQGEDAKPLYELVRETIKEGVWYDEKTNTMLGSSPFIAARVDTEVRPRFRVTNLRDLSRRDIRRTVKDKSYIDSPELVARSATDSYNRNMPLLEKIIAIVEEKEGKVRFPFKISGFDVQAWSEDRKGYGLIIVPRDDFTVVHDERLDGKYNGSRFTEVDDNGLTVGLPKFDKNGKRKWYARNEGLSRLDLYWGLDLGSDGVDLADSSRFGRVVLVRGEATPAGLENFQQDFLREVNKEYELRLKQLNERKKSNKISA